MYIYLYVCVCVCVVCIHAYIHTSMYTYGIAVCLAWFQGFLCSGTNNAIVQVCDGTLC